MDIKKLIEYQKAERENRILIKALLLNDSEVEELKNNFCSFGWDVFRSPYSYRTKLKVLFNERPEETDQLIKQKFNLHKDSDTYYFIKKRCFIIYTGSDPDYNTNQLKLFSNE